MNINVQFQGLQNLMRASGYGARIFGNQAFFQGLPNQAGAAAGLLGLMGRFSRLGAVVTAATTTLGALGSAAIYAGRRIRDQGMFGLSMGGTSSQGLMLRAFGGAAGLGLGELSALGEQVGGFNRSERLLQQIERIRSLSRWEEVLQYTRGRGLEALQATWFLTRRQTDALRREAQARQGLFGLQATARAVRFNHELERSKRTFGDILAGIGGEVLGHGNRIFQSLNDFFSGGANAVGGGQTAALKENTAALRSHGAELRGAARTMGGGRRAQGSIPAALRGEVFNDALQRRAIQWGALIP